MISLATDRRYVEAGVDLVDALGGHVSDEDMARLKQRLEPHGLESWLNEP